MTNLEKLLKNKKFSYEIDWEWQITVKFFKHSFLLIKNDYDENRKQTEWWITILWDKNSNLSKQKTKKAFINFIKILKENNIKYVFDELLDFN